MDKPTDWTTGFKRIYRDGRFYDLHTRGFEDDIPFYVKLAKSASSVLELACGTGRLTIPMAKETKQMVGLDISEGMLMEARRKACNEGVNLKLVRADMRVFHFKAKFDLIILAFNSICHLYTRDDVERCFQCVRSHLAKDGQFVIDVFNPSLEILSRSPMEFYPVGEYEDPDSGGTVTISECTDYNRATQISQLTWYIDSPGNWKEVRFGMRVFFPQEIDALLHYNGFKIISKFGDFDGKAFCGNSLRQIIISTLR